MTVDVGDELHEKQAESRLQELRDLLAEQARLKSSEAALEESWMSALEQLEALEQQLAQAD